MNADQQLVVVEGVGLVWTIVQGLATSVLGYFVWRIRNDRADFNQMEDRFRKQVTAAAVKLDEEAKARATERDGLTSKLLDERFRRMSHDLDNAVNGIVLKLGEMYQRLDDGDGAFEKLGDRDHTLEIKTLKEVSDLKTQLIERIGGLATKEDLKSHQKDVSGMIEGMRSQMHGGRNRA